MQLYDIASRYDFTALIRGDRLNLITTILQLLVIIAKGN